ncbi:MAG: hypothetical protein JWM96_1316 [Alphaproteobacteria bacterium]|nr:hypothetical protein [Alphaproteobacteria bacterium]
MNEENFSFELRLLREIEQIEKKIKELTSEKSALQRLLMKYRSEKIAFRDVNRKNSVNRVMIENKITEALRLARKPLRTDALYSLARQIDFQLKANTFRTHLHRMKAKNLIQASGRRGLWLLPNIDNGGEDRI